jgi:hypothetical protein
VFIPLETDYLQETARQYGISRTKLVRVVMEKIVRDELVSKILDEEMLIEPAHQRYRRFRKGNAA